MPTFSGTVPNITDLQNLDTTNLTDNTPLLIREKRQWYYLSKPSAIAADEDKVVTANPTGRWLAVNVNTAIVDTVNNTPQQSPSKTGELILCLPSLRMFVGTDLTTWTELPIRGVNFGANDPTTLLVVPRFEGDFFADTSLNRLYISTDGATWVNLPLTDGQTNVSLDANVITSAPAYAGNLAVLTNPERVYVSVGTLSTSDWRLLKTNQIHYDINNATPQTAPTKVNDLLLVSQTGKWYIAVGTTNTDDWVEFISFSFDVVVEDPTPAPNGVRKFSYNSVKHQLWISDGANTTLIGDINQKSNHLFLDVENYVDYASFVDIDGDIGLQIYWHPLSIPYFYHDGTQIQPYLITQYANAPWTNTGGTSANDDKAMYVDNVAINAARTTNGGSGVIDLSAFLEINGVGNYFFIPTMLDEAGSTYKSIGDANSVINLGLEFTVNDFNKTTKILDFKYDNTEFNFSSPGSQLSTIKGAFGSYDLASATYMKTLNGGVKFLQISEYPVNCTIQVKPYELLTDYGDFYA